MTLTLDAGPLGHWYGIHKRCGSMDVVEVGHSWQEGTLYACHGCWEGGWRLAHDDIEWIDEAELALRILGGDK